MCTSFSHSIGSSSTHTGTNKMILFKGFAMGMLFSLSSAAAPARKVATVPGLDGDVLEDYRKKFHDNGMYGWSKGADDDNIWENKLDNPLDEKPNSVKYLTDEKPRHNLPHLIMVEKESHWVKVLHLKSGKVYFYNTESKKKQIGCPYMAIAKEHRTKYFDNVSDLKVLQQYDEVEWQDLIPIKKRMLPNFGSSTYFFAGYEAITDDEDCKRGTRDITTGSRPSMFRQLLVDCMIPDYQVQTKPIVRPVITSQMNRYAKGFHEQYVATKLYAADCKPKPISFDKTKHICVIPIQLQKDGEPTKVKEFKRQFLNLMQDIWGSCEMGIHWSNAGKQGKLSEYWFTIVYKGKIGKRPEKFGYQEQLRALNEIGRKKYRADKIDELAISGYCYDMWVYRCE